MRRAKLRGRLRMVSYVIVMGRHGDWCRKVVLRDRRGREHIRFTLRDVDGTRVGWERLRYE